ncbi:unnamed protein product [Prorocentrum cordatum]|uniref:Secreted protein n=1 Tax=Prorocentrum cordatum TaxID=2364126 RepID=A0ABN9TUC1_9DINO|nr:unnamed protein product [Polarella glacialis]
MNWRAELLSLILKRHGALECMMLPLVLPLLSHDVHTKPLYPQLLVMTTTSGEPAGTTSARNGTDWLALPIPHNPKKLCMMLHAIFCRLEWLPLLMRPLRPPANVALSFPSGSPHPSPSCLHCHPSLLFPLSNMIITIYSAPNAWPHAPRSMHVARAKSAAKCTALGVG